MDWSQDVFAGDCSEFETSIHQDTVCQDEGVTAVRPLEPSDLEKAERILAAYTWKFQMRCVETVHSLDALRARLVSGRADEPTDPADLDQLCRIAHGVSGTAGTFGYRNISLIAQQLEETLLSSPCDNFMATLDVLIVELRAVGGLDRGRAIAVARR